MEHTLPPEHPIAAVGSFVVVGHEASSRSHLVQEWSEQLRQSQPDREVHNVWLRGDNIAACREQVVGAIACQHEQGIDEPLLISAGGDGAMHFNGNAILHKDTPSTITKTIMTSWKLGRANDWYTQMHDPRTAGSPTALFEHPGGQICESSPLEVTTVSRGAAHSDHAFLYATFGASADALCALDSAKHRARRARFPAWTHDLIDVAATAPIVLGIPRSARAATKGKVRGRPVVEAEFINGERMAERADFSRYTTLDDGAMFYSEVNHRNPIALGAFAARLVLGHPPGYRTDQGIILNFLEGSLHGQIDGIPLTDTHGNLSNVQAVRVVPGQQAIRYYATKRHSRKLEHY